VEELQGGVGWGGEVEGEYVDGVVEGLQGGVGWVLVVVVGWGHGGEVFMGDWGGGGVVNKWWCGGVEGRYY